MRVSATWLGLGSGLGLGFRVRVRVRVGATGSKAAAIARYPAHIIRRHATTCAFGSGEM